MFQFFFPGPRRAIRIGALIFAIGAVRPHAARAQSIEGLAAQAEVTAGSELENYLRTLQSLGEVPVHPWTIRAFSPSELGRLAPGDTSGPWALRYDLRSDSTAGPRFALLRPTAELIYNSSFPSGGNDGPIWAGRGVTSAVGFGFVGRYGPLSAVLAPMAFWAQNADFTLSPNGETDFLRFGALGDPRAIDLPQRFGDGPYARIDPGQSTLRLDLLGVAAAVSTANQYWGPATDHPVLLGNNAGGFPHLALGTSLPVDLGIGRIHGRLLWGRLDQSDYSPVGGEGRRLMSGLVATFSPHFPEGLEIGAARFFHSTWPESGPGWRDLTRPLEGIFKIALDERFGSNPELNADNQLASVFARWVLPGSGFELYGEFGRDDHPWDARNLILRPDDVSAYLLGFRKAWHLTGEPLLVLRGEVLNTQVSHLWRVDTVRRQPRLYIHNSQRQGHTHRGQMLASPAGFGGGAGLLAADYYHGSGRWTVAWEREVRAMMGDIAAESRDSGRDVIQTLRLESLMFRGPLEVLAGIGGVLDLNRDFSGSDRASFRASLALRTALGPGPAASDRVPPTGRER